MKSEEEIKAALEVLKEAASRISPPKEGTGSAFINGQINALLWVLGEE